MIQDLIGKDNEFADEKELLKAIISGVLTSSEVQNIIKANRTLFQTFPDRTDLLESGVFNNILFEVAKALKNGEVTVTGLPKYYKKKMKDLPARVEKEKEKYRLSQEAREKFFAALEETAPIQARKEQDCSKHDWSDWIVLGSGTLTVPEKNATENSKRVTDFVHIGKIFVRSSRSARRFCSKCGKAQRTILNNPKIVAKVEGMVKETLSMMCHSEFLEKLYIDWDFQHGRHLEERALKTGRDWWAELGYLWSPGDSIINWTPQCDIAELFARVSATADPNLTALWEAWRKNED